VVWNTSPPERSGRRSAKVAVVPGAAFGPHGEGFLRLTCVRSDRDVEVSLARIEEFSTALA
jgi:aspartate/methionine/tyrosine aminotransferase